MIKIRYPRDLQKISTGVKIAIKISLDGIQLYL